MVESFHFLDEDFSPLDRFHTHDVHHLWTIHLPFRDSEHSHTFNIYVICHLLVNSVITWKQVTVIVHVIRNRTFCLNIVTFKLIKFPKQYYDYHSFCYAWLDRLCIVWRCPNYLWRPYLYHGHHRSDTYNNSNSKTKKAIFQKMAVKYLGLDWFKNTQTKHLWCWGDGLIEVLVT